MIGPVGTQQRLCLEVADLQAVLEQVDQHQGVDGGGPAGVAAVINAYAAVVVHRALLLGEKVYASRGNGNKRGRSSSSMACTWRRALPWMRGAKNPGRGPLAVVNLRLLGRGKL